MGLANSRLVTAVACLLGATAVVFGLINIFDPITGLTFFEIPPPTTPEGRQLLEVLLIALGIRDIFQGVVIFATAALGSRRALAIVLIASGACAAVDGWACQVKVGAGEWNHWSYAPVLVALGFVKLGVLG